ncbi:LysR family transcriptional regulator [Acerihabitans arboris]|uniref:LysR family transcriptional regulator n=1 Tax=Acerihabitans arboris TaxID=2691583 RepID=A0A845SIH8_9GAMM|nr:LysR family transcriptional regulator [Acerihabitans arboris]NDL64963.1 LysR family transcriptional regulator [Acerihabitans arboris]
MDKLTAMTTFVRVAELGSLSAAARDLGLTQPAVSQQIAGLEKHLGTLLLYRTTRSVTLTESGSRYYPQAKQILMAMSETEEALRGLNQGLAGHLRIHAPTGLGQHYITRLAIDFQQRHPDIVIELLLDDRVADVVSEGIDVAVRLGDLRTAGTVARRLGTLARVLVASPGYLALQGTPRTPAELAGHAYIRYSGRGDGAGLTLIGPKGAEIMTVHPVFLANNSMALMQAIEAGIGIGGAQLPLIRQRLTGKTLVRVLPDYHFPPMAVHAVYPDTRFIPAKVRAWVDCLAAAWAGMV